MKSKINFKQILATLGLLSIATPLILNVNACGLDPNNSNDSDKIIETINNIDNLQIDISDIEETSVLDVLKAPKNGVAMKIDNRNISNFDISLFILDDENIYDVNREKIDAKNTPVVINQIYYFQFFYNGKNNEVLVPVKIINLDQEVVAAIKNIEYKVSVDINSPVEKLKNIIDSSFIKRNLNLEMQQIFKDNKWEKESIIITDEKNNPLTNENLEIEQEIKGHIIFKYGFIVDVETNLAITITDPEKIVETIDASTFNKEIFIHSINTVAELKSQIGNFIKEQLTDENIKEKFNIYQFVIDKITIDDKNGAELKDSDLAEVQDLNMIIHYKYGSIVETHFTNLVINLKIGKITPEKFVEIANLRSEKNPFKFIIPIIADGDSETYLEIIAKAMKEQIEKEFQDIEKYSIDSTKLNINTEDITSENMDPKEIAYAWFTEEKTFNALTSISYGDLPTGNINIIFEVIKG